MADAQDFVNNALNGDDDPSSYVDWLGKKEDVGPLARIRFGVHIHTTDEEVIAQNAKEDGTVTDEAFWKQIVEDAHWLEENMAILLREMGLYVQGEGHGDSGEYVGSAWILATLPQEQQVYVAKKIIDLADGDMPSTTNGTLWKCFYDSPTKLYRNVNQEIGAKYLDVTVEFTGTDALTEWLKLNLVESEAVDADDPALVVQNYRKLWYKLFYGPKPGHGSFVGVYTTVNDGVAAAKHRGLRKFGRYVWLEEEGDPDVTDSRAIVSSEPTGVVYDIGPKYVVTRRVTEAQDADDPAMFVQHFLPRMTGRLMIEFNAIRPHFPDAPKNFFRENADGLILFQHNRASEMREIMRQMHVYNREREDRNEIPMVTYRYKVPNPHGDVLAREFLEKAGTNVETIAWAEKTNAPIWFYMSVDEFNNYLRYVYPQIKLKEDIDDPDAPEGYLDRVTGWIDTFIHAGLVPDPSPAHSNQFWKRYECDGTNFSIYVHVRPPLWILVVRTHPTTGTGQFTLPFTFNEKDTAGMVTQFRALDRLLTKCRTRARGDWPAVDAEIIDMEKQNERDRKLKLSGRRKLGEADADDPPADVNTLLDKVSPEPCFACNADLTKPFTVVRHYVSKGNDADLTLEGHYDPVDGIFTNEEQPSLEFYSALSHYDLPEDCDTCKHCGQSTAKPDSLRNESVEDEPEVDPQTYADQIHNLAQITHDIQEYGLFVNRIHVWGRWVVLGGGAYWATETAASEKRLKADYFNKQIDSFMAKLGITRYHIKSGETAIGDNVWFQLALPKDQLEQESWQPFIRNTAWPEPDHETWLPEAQEAAPDEADDPELNVERHTADLDLPAIMNRLGFKAVHFKHTGTTYWEKVVGPRCFTVSRDKGQNALLKVHASFGTPQSWVDASVASVPINELETTLNQTPNFLNYPNDPVVESVDPDDPSVNVDRHVASMEPGPVLTELGFHERWPLWNCADPNYMWWERFDNMTGVKWTAIRKSDDEPHIMDVSISRMNPVTKDWQQVGGFNVHVGGLRKKLEKAFGVNWKTYEAVDDPDAPEPNIEAYKQHVEKTEADALESAIENALLMFGHRVSNVDDAKRADELAVEIATYWAEAAGYQNGSDEYDHIVSALSNRAGELFPGDWEDYPNTLRPPLAESLASAQMDWSEFFAPLIAANLLSQAAADKYARSQNLESNEQLYYLFLEADEASQYANDDDYNACIDKILRIIRVTNMRYGSAIKDIATNPALDTSLEENVDDVDDPSPALLSDAFDVPTILKRRGYERHGDDYAWSKVYHGFGKHLDYMIEVRQRGYGGGDAGNAVYDATLFHYLVADNPKKEWTPFAHRYARNNKNLEPMLKALEARVAANKLRGIVPDPDEVVESVDPDDPENVIGKGGKWIIVAAKPHPHKPGRTFKIFVTLWNSTYLDNPKDTTTEFGYPGAENHWQSWEPRPQGWRDAQIIKARFDRQVGQPGGWTTELVPYNPDKSIVWHQRYLKENIDDPDDAAMAVNTYTQDLVADPDEVKINKHPHGEAEAELEVLGFKPSWIAGKNTIFGEPEIPNFWSKPYRSAHGGSSKLLYVKIIPEGKDAAISVRTRSMSIPVSLQPRSMAHIVTIIKDVDAAVQRAADNGLTKEQEIDAIVGVLDHHRQWCRPS